MPVIVSVLLTTMAGPEITVSTTGKVELADAAGVNGVSLRRCEGMDGKLMVCPALATVKVWFVVTGR
jgi:hypothetical protein